MKVAIVYYQFLDLMGESRVVGGIETYLYNLSKVIDRLNWEVQLFQCSKKAFKKNIGSLTVIGLPIYGHSNKDIKKLLYREAIKSISKDSGILIFGSDHISVKTDYRYAISIQHGVGWDLPTKFLTKKPALSKGFGGFAKKIQSTFTAIRDFENCPNRVCVDYNFLNWYRAISPEAADQGIWVVPNATKIPRDYYSRKLTKQTSILFARRFTEYRGTRLMINVAKKILLENRNATFTFAGEGPMESDIQKIFVGEPRVKLIKYPVEKTLEIHRQHDIAVIPSLGSEGTSFSIVEAMAAGCAICSTNIGGITNMILNGYNGLLVFPREEDLLEGILSLTKNRSERIELGKKAFETAKKSFSFSVWQNSWTKILRGIQVG